MLYVPYILYTTVIAQQMNLLPENASQNDAIFDRSVYCRYGTTSHCLSSYGCTITMVSPSPNFTSVEEMINYNCNTDYCEESCAARYRHFHLSLDFASQEFGIEPNVSTIQSSLSVAIQNRGNAHLNILGEVKWWEMTTV